SVATVSESFLTE
nr:Chain C, Hoef-peptide (L9F) [Hoeflea phototrophica DFL-43]4Z2P_P Chain P, Hoef-peptide (L9F) [Hoeflea phototrophica DFL-43]